MEDVQVPTAACLSSCGDQKALVEKLLYAFHHVASLPAIIHQGMQKAN